MILPTKQLKLENSIFYYVCQALKLLSLQSYHTFELYTTLQDTNQNLLFTDFLLALDILKALDKIQYKNQLLELVK